MYAKESFLLGVFWVASFHLWLMYVWMSFSLQKNHFLGRFRFVVFT